MAVESPGQPKPGDPVHTHTHTYTHTPPRVHGVNRLEPRASCYLIQTQRFLSLIHNPQAQLSKDLLHAAACGKTGLVAKFLWNPLANPNCATRYNMTPLHYAVQKVWAFVPFPVFHFIAPI